MPARSISSRLQVPRVLRWLPGSRRTRTSVWPTAEATRPMGSAVQAASGCMGALSRPRFAARASCAPPRGGAYTTYESPALVRATVLADLGRGGGQSHYDGSLRLRTQLVADGGVVAVVARRVMLQSTGASSPLEPRHHSAERRLCAGRMASRLTPPPAVPRLADPVLAGRTRTRPTLRQNTRPGPTPGGPSGGPAPSCTPARPYWPGGARTRRTVLAGRRCTRRTLLAGRRPMARIHPAVARARRSLGLVLPSFPALVQGEIQRPVVVDSCDIADTRRRGTAHADREVDGLRMREAARVATNS